MVINLSVVIPLFNEQKNINDLYTRLKKTLSKISKSTEIIFVDDGSVDKTLETLRGIAKKDKKVKVLSFTRNFGHMQAVSAGLNLAVGKKVVVMDADLQDPPEVIEKMWLKAAQGYDIVYGVKIKRKESVLKRFLFSAFYRVIRKISRIEMPLDAGTFSLLDYKVVKTINSLPERNKYFSGLRAWTGFSSVGIIYKRGKRLRGRAKSFSLLFSMAIDGLLSFSYLPLRIASFMGFLFASLSFVFIVIVFVARYFFDKGIIGWASTMSATLLIGGVQLITLGIIGEYLGRIYDEVKNRPEYIIKEKFGFRK